MQVGSDPCRDGTSACVPAFAVPASGSPAMASHWEQKASIRSSCSIVLERLVERASRREGKNIPRQEAPPVRVEPLRSRRLPPTVEVVWWNPELDFHLLHCKQRLSGFISQF